MKTKTLILAFLLIFPLTAQANAAPLEKVIDLVNDRGEPVWVAPELKKLMSITNQKDLTGMQVYLHNGYGTLLTLIVCQPWNPLRTRLIVIEPSGKVRLKNGSLVASSGRNLWLTDKNGRLLASAYQSTDDGLKKITASERAKQFKEILADLEQWQKVTRPAKQSRR